ncbi:hypothetical protein [Azospirillum halopraeferens]|uniref:hypothetical protein n=1 Tax=Azospirillum halopraeferens TaxID=34010 RepID=UPI0004114CC2|nr:hypothetical protein [Azospirillum halopraeferens]
MAGSGTGHPLETPARRAWRRFARHRLAVHALGLLTALLLTGLLEPLINGRYQADPLLRALGAAPETLALAVLAGGTGAVAGLAWGCAAALAGGRAARALVAPARALAVLPLPLLPVLAAGLWGRDPGLLALAIGAAMAPAVAVAAHRATVASARWTHLAAAEAAGLGAGRILMHHRLPGLTGPFLLAAWPALPGALAAEGFAGLLGFGMPPEPATWGTLLGAAAAGPLGAGLLAPAGLLALALAALHVIGDGVRRAVGEVAP